MLVCPLCRLVLGDDETTCPRDGTEGATVEPVAVPASVRERFAIVEPFARGAAGDLYLADDQQTGRRGILKLLRRPEKTTPAERARLKRELVKQATLSHGVLSVPLATGDADDRPWIFREWHEGVSLRVRLARGGALPQQEAFAIAAQMASALDELHRAGLLHRDLKPGHVLLMPQPSGLPRVAVIDAGIAAKVDSGAAFDVMGSPGYCSPEQAKGKLVSFRSDLYALGCVLYEMLTGAPPFSGDTEALLEAHASQPPPTPTISLPAGVSTLLSQLMSKEARERPFSAQQVKRALAPFLPEDASSQREATQTFEKLQRAAPRRPASSGSGTLRPPRSIKKTTLGIAAAKSVPPPPPNARPSAGPPKASAPPPPPPSTAPPSARKNASVPPPTPSPARPNAKDATEELSAMDLADAEALLSGKKKPRPDRTEELSAVDLAQAEAITSPRKAATSVPPPPKTSRTILGMPAQGGSAPEVAPSVTSTKPGFGADEAPTALSAPPVHSPPPGASGPSTEPGFQDAPAEADVTSKRPALSSAPPPPPPISESGPTMPGPLDPPVSGTGPTMAGPLEPPVSATGPTMAGPLEPPVSGTGPTMAGPLEPPVSGTGPTMAGPLEAPAGTKPSAAVPWADASPASGAPIDSGDDGGGLDYDDLAETQAFDRDTEKAPGLLGKLDDYESRPDVAPASAPPPATAPASAPPPSVAVASAPVPSAAVPGEQVSAPTHSTAPTTQAEPVKIPGNRALPFLAVAAVAGICVLGTVATGLAVWLGGEDDPPIAMDAPAPPSAQPAPVPQPAPVAQPAVAQPAPVAQPVAAPADSPDEQSVEEPAEEPAEEPVTEEAEPVEEPAEEAAQRAAAREPAREARPARRGRREESRPSRTAPARSAPSGGNRMQQFQAARDEARDHFRARRFPQAAAAYERATRLNPRHAGSFAGLGAARIAARQPRQAIAAYQRAVALQPRNAAFHAALGQAYQQAGDGGRARAAYQRALAIDPSNAGARRGLSSL
ncbi:MAG: hypothetical protein SangKO_100390 [Sandaracinaceae bacterium]